MFLVLFLQYHIQHQTIETTSSHKAWYIHVFWNWSSWEVGHLKYKMKTIFHYHVAHLSPKDSSFTDAFWSLIFSLFFWEWTEISSHNVISFYQWNQVKETTGVWFMESSLKTIPINTWQHFHNWPVLYIDLLRTTGLKPGHVFHQLKSFFGRCKTIMTFCICPLKLYIGSMSFFFFGILISNKKIDRLLAIIHIGRLYKIFINISCDANGTRELDASSFPAAGC